MGNLLAPFKKFLSNKNTITILGVLLGIVVLYFGYTWRVNNSVQPTKVPYATTKLSPGTKITESVIGYTDVPKSMIKQMTNLITNVGDLTNSQKPVLVSYDSTIPPNGFFFSENIILESEMPDSIFSDIPKGNTIYVLKVDVNSTYGNAIFPGDAIDLYMKTEDEDNKVVFGRLISSIKVEAVRDKKGKNVFLDKDNPTDSAMLLFSVPEQYFLLLKKAEFLDIEIIPVPRNSDYTTSAAATQLQSDELYAMIIDQTHTLSHECLDLTTC